MSLLQHIRSTLRDLGFDRAHPQICVVAPSNGSHGFLRRRLLRENGDGFLRMRFTEPDLLVRDLGEPALVRAGKQAEALGWLESTVASALGDVGEGSRALAPYVERLQAPGWLPFLVNAVTRLEGAGVRTEALRSVRHPEDPVRLELVAAVLARVEEARRAQATYGAGDIARAALAAVRAGDVPRPVARDEIIIVYGDRTVAPTAFDALCAWFGCRPGLRLVFQPHEAAPESETGLRRAAVAADYRPVAVHSESAPALGRVQRHLFSREATAEPPAPPDGAIRFIRALDEVREVREVVRAALDALKDGAPLDGVAIALPNETQADLLKAELERAQLPASIIAGPPLASTPVARALVAAFGMNAEAVAPETLHRWLQHPAVRVPGRGGLPPRSRARWRRLLVEIGPARGFSSIVDALRALADSRAREDADHEDRTALAELIAGIEDLRSDVALPDEAPWDAYRERFHALVKRWLRPHPARSLIDGLLEPRVGRVGAAITRNLAIDLLRARLDREPLTSGSVNEPAIRVVPPLALVGSRFHTVIVPGLTDTAFPAPPVGDVVLSDELVHGLNEQLDARLESSRIGEDLERRRLAAIVGAAEHRLVMTFPRGQLVDGRALQPSPYLTEVVDALGRGRSSDAVWQMIADAEVNAVGTTRDPRRAVHAAEQRLSELDEERPEQERAAAIRNLATAPMARGLLEAAQSRDRLRASLEAGAPTLDAHTGLVGREHLPDDALERAWSSSALAALIEAPLVFLLQHVLGAWPARRFRQPSDPWNPKDATRLLRRAFDEAGRQDEEWPAAFDASTAARVGDACESIAEHLHDILRNGVGRTASEWAEALSKVTRVGVLAEEVELTAGWRLRPETFALSADGDLVVPWYWRDQEAAKTKPERVVAESVRALGLTRAGETVAAVRAVSPKHPWPRGADEPAQFARELLDAATDRVSRGLWPSVNTDPKYGPRFSLVEEPAIPSDQFDKARGGDA